VKRQITNWTAEAFVFSGRQNPQWILTEEQADDWMNLWQRASSSDKEEQQPSRLGYTGCRLQLNEHSYWHMFDGCVSFYDKGQVISKEDEERKLEYFLLNTASAEIKEILHSLKVI
jgi:hypothetical protein